MNHLSSFLCSIIMLRAFEERDQANMHKKDNLYTYTYLRNMSTWDL